MSFAGAWPFPHIVIDNFAPEATLDAVLAEWPDVEHRSGWGHFSNDLEEKWAWTKGAPLGPVTAALMADFNDATFLAELGELTGIEGLVGDPDFIGGGPHEIRRGGKLALHADFNRHPDTGLDRRLNALLYLNRDWRDEWGGHIQLWNADLTECASYAPIFNRMVIFATTSTSWHGHPDPLTCPEGVSRRSLAFYYYTDGRPAGEATGDHSTVFMRAAA